MFKTLLTRTNRDKLTTARQRKWRENLDAYLLLMPALLIYLVFVVYPVVSTIHLSFYSYGLTDARIDYIGLQNYRMLFDDAIFYRAVRNNLTIMVGSVVFQVGVGVILAAVLSRGIRWGKTFFRTLHFAPVVMSAVAVGILWQLIYNPQVGILNEVLDVVGITPPRQGWLGDPDLVIYAVLVAACWQYTGYVMTIVLAGMESVPEELYEAASLDGANEIQNFLHITLPSIRNVVIAATLITMIGAIKVFDIVYVLTRGGPANSSQVLGTYVYYNAFTVGRAGYASAIAVILLGLAALMGVLQLRYSRQIR